MEVRERKGLAVVTGASSGIGLELAKLFAADSYDLLIAARSEHVHEVASRMREAGTTVQACQADLSTPEGVETLHAAILAAEQPLEAIWPAAGFTDTLFRCEGEAGGAPCSVASSDVSSRSRRFD